MICIGLNPSTAVPMNLDFTVGRVRNYALGKYRAWYMLNLYPQRATDSDDLDKDESFNKITGESKEYPGIIARNIQHIKDLLKSLGKENCDVWCAWGTAITKRGYIEEICTEKIGQLLDGYDTLYAYTKNEATIGTEFYPGHPQVMPKDPMLKCVTLCNNGKVKLKNQ